MTAREKFYIGQAVRTTDPGYTLKGHDERVGNVAGFCRDAEYVRVTWVGWQPKSSVAIHMDKLSDLS